MAHKKWSAKTSYFVHRRTKTHLSLQLSRWCDENGIILYALPPNTTQIMQPADVIVFKHLKSEWKKTVLEWQAKPENINCILTKSTFCPLLVEVLNMLSLSKSIINGFKRCGLYPLDPNVVDYSKCIQNKLECNAKPDRQKFSPQELDKTEQT
ncbi:hypothetical protein NQ314_003539 [Rhamnusium bicolor]|uniref:DDE-1 domain-containing protein n=1 Tax=Rhamnusium bicolor TaxID=1586634 RepID=A0AAV8ZLT6_9CUCU|nr:hypothetical protein NQ314_003539 [Rhamnusium bicolor]